MYFSDNPSDRYYERMMVGIPNFKPRGHGVVIVGSRPTEPLVILRIQDGTATHREILTETTKAINHRRFRHRHHQQVMSRVMRKIDFGIWQKSITGGGLTAPWLLFSRQGAKGQGRRYAARLALDAL